jgi:hypothetical protein
MMAARMLRSLAVERLTRGPARRRLGLHPLLPRVLLRLHRSQRVPPCPTLGTSRPTCFSAVQIKGMGPWVQRRLVPSAPEWRSAWVRLRGRRGPADPNMTVLRAGLWVRLRGRGSAGAGCAGAATAGACGLCVAGSYQTGSGSSWQRRAEECALGACIRARWLRSLDGIDAPTPASLLETCNFLSVIYGIAMPVASGRQLAGQSVG